jgi:hypothetical protein
MAKLGGILPLKGKIGNITFLKTKNGIIAREKGGVDPKRIATDPAFVRTRMRLWHLPCVTVQDHLNLYWHRNAIKKILIRWLIKKISDTI